MNVVSRRYARALIQALPNERADEGLDGLLQLSGILNAEPDARRLLLHPGVSQERREAFIHGLSEALALDGPVRRLFSLLVERRRLALLEEVTQACQEQLDERTGTLRVEVASTQALGGAERADLKARLERSTGKRVVISVREDPAILGGIVVKMGSTVFDASLRQQLVSARQQLGAD